MDIYPESPQRFECEYGGRSGLRYESIEIVSHAGTCFLLPRSLSSRVEPLLDSVVSTAGWVPSQGASCVSARLKREATLFAGVGFFHVDFFFLTRPRIRRRLPAPRGPGIYMNGPVGSLAAPLSSPESGIALEQSEGRWRRGEHGPARGTRQHHVL